jgi:hypothetical protein
MIEQRIPFAAFRDDPEAVFDRVARGHEPVLIERECRLYRLPPLPDQQILPRAHG